MGRRSTAVAGTCVAVLAATGLGLRVSGDLPGQEAGSTAGDAAQAIEAHRTASRGPEQPFPFNHRFHAGPDDLAIPCMYCHSGTERSQTGVVPSLEVCMGCHRVAGSGLEPVERMREVWTEGEAVEWEWVNKLPEFVQFNHAPHVRNGVECQECHGPVEEMDRVYQWAPLTMGWCLSCHRTPPQETDVTSATLALAADVPHPPAGREEKGLYPESIDSEYARWRGPIDCLSCHY